MSENAVQAFKDLGYLVLRGAMSPEEVAEINRDTVDLCRGRYGSFGGFTGEQADLDDDELLRQYLCIHYPHKASPLMRQKIAHPRTTEALIGMIGPNVKCMQSMLFIKAAGKPGQAWHQDEDYIPTRDRSLTGAWIALDDATVENGCLWVIPGSHKRGVLWPQAQQEDSRFDCSRESTGFPYSDEDAVAVEVEAGDVVCFNGYLLHRSLPNRATSGYRRALVNHYMSAESLLPWTVVADKHTCFIDDSSRAVAKADSRDIVMVAGEDPYAWMGTTQVNKPHVRPDGVGGCGKTASDTGKAMG